MIGFWRNRLYQLPCCSFFHHKRSTAPNYLQPHLTTIRYPVIEMATQAARLAIALAHGEPAPDVTNLFIPTLVRRYSVIPVVPV